MRVLGLTLRTVASVNLAACHISYLSAWSASICCTSMNRSLFSSSRSSLLRSNCATPILALMFTSSSSSSSAPSASTALRAPLPPPLPLAPFSALPPTRLGVPSFSAASRAFSALLFRPRFRGARLPVAETAEPETILALSLSRPTLGDRGPNGASSGGKDVCRRGWAEPVEATDMVEGLRRFEIGEGPAPSAVRLRLRPFVLIEGSWVFEGVGGDMAGGECCDDHSVYGGELMLATGCRDALMKDGCFF